jgi:hypothetical protein
VENGKTSSETSTSAESGATWFSRSIVSISDETGATSIDESMARGRKARKRAALALNTNSSVLHSEGSMGGGDGGMGVLREASRAASAAPCVSVPRAMNAGVPRGARAAAMNASRGRRACRVQAPKPKRTGGVAREQGHSRPTSPRDA